MIYLLQAAAVAGPECEAGVVAEAAGLTRGAAARRLRPGRGVTPAPAGRAGHTDRYIFTHTLVRDAIYGELLRGRRVRYHHKIAVATERAHAADLETYVNELAHHFYMGAALADADKACHYCQAAGRTALRLLAFEEAALHFTRGLEVAEQSGWATPGRCDVLMALAEAQERAGDTVLANANFERAAEFAARLWATPSAWPPRPCGPGR